MSSDLIFPYLLVITRQSLPDIKHLINIKDPSRLVHLYIYGSDKAAVTGLLDYNTRERIDSLNNFCLDFNLEEDKISLLSYKRISELLIDQLQSKFSEIRQTAIEALTTCGKKKRNWASP